MKWFDTREQGAARKPDAPGTHPHSTELPQPQTLTVNAESE